MIGQEYRAALRFLRRNLRPLAAAAALFVLSALAAGAAFFVFSSNDPALINRTMADIFSAFDAKELSGPDGGLDPLRLFLSNAYAAIFAFLFGIVPVLFLPVWPLLLNAVLLGVVAAASLRMGLPPAALAASLLPHGIFELPALILSGSLGFILCHSVTRRLFGKPEPLPFWALAHELSRLFVLGVLPLLALAALIESSLTGWIAGFFL